MNTESLKEVIRKAKESSISPELRKMVDAFEKFLSLYAQRSQNHTNPEEYLRNLNEAYRTTQEALETAAKFYGLTGKVVQEYLMNPENFTAEQWQDMEALKYKLESSDASAVSRPAHKKLRKSSYTVRI